jgi:hypothetical protein
MLAVAVALSDLWPGDAVVVQRVADDSLDWLRQTLMWADRSSAAPIPFVGGLPIVCHEAAVRPAAMQLLQDCGLRSPSEIVSYHDFEDMRGIVADQVGHGRRIGITYTSRRLLAPAEAYVNHPELVADVNDKANLASLLPPEAVLARCIVPRDALPATLEARRAGLPFVLKASSRLGSGGGSDVLICRSPDDLEAAEHKFAHAERVVIETFCDFAATWCLHFAVGDGGVVYCGAAQQICDERGTYHGNWCGPGPGPGDEAIEFARHAAQAGRSRGYRGFVGVDVGRTEAGRCFGFDLNFRNNGSTPQVVLRDAIADAWGATCTRLCIGVDFGGTFAAIIERLWAFHLRRELLPLLAFDMAQHVSDPRPRCNLLVAGSTPEAVGATLGELRRVGFGVEAA